MNSLTNFNTISHYSFSHKRQTEGPRSLQTQGKYPLAAVTYYRWFQTSGRFAEKGTSC